MRLVPATVPARAPGQPVLGATPGQLAVVVGASAVAGVSIAASGDLLIPLGLLAFAVLTVLGYVRPAIFVGVFLATRPLLDAFNDKQFVHGLASANPAGLVAVLMISMTVVGLTTSRHVFVPQASAALGLVLLVSIFAGIWAMVNRGDVGTKPLSELFRIAAFLAIYVLAANLFGTVRRARLLFAIVGLSAVPPAIIGIVQWINGVKPAQGFETGRIDSSFVGPNPFGAYMAVAALVLIGGTPQLPRRVRIPSLVLVLVALVGTYSRMGWVMFLLGMILLGWRKHRGQVIAVVVVVTGLVFAVPSIHDRVLPTKDPVGAVGAGGAPKKGTYDSFNWRLKNWGTLLEKYSKSPVVGYGLRTTPYVNPRRTQALAPPSAGFEAHNTVVKALVEGGPPLLLVYVLLAGTLIGTSRRMARTDWPLQRLGALMFVFWVVLVVVGVGTDDPLGNTTTMFALLALAGALEGAHRRYAPQATFGDSR